MVWSIGRGKLLYYYPTLFHSQRHPLHLRMQRTQLKASCPHGSALRGQGQRGWGKGSPGNVWQYDATSICWVLFSIHFKCLSVNIIFPACLVNNYTKLCIQNNCTKLCIQMETKKTGASVIVEPANMQKLPLKRLKLPLTNLDLL